MARRLLQADMHCFRGLTPLVSVMLAALPAAAGAQVQDHLSCFAVKDSAARGKYQVTIVTSAGPQACVVKTPAKIGCVPAAKTVVSPAPPGGGPVAPAVSAFLCYKAKCPKPSGSGNAADQFGTRTVTFRGSRYVCAPADLNAPAPGSTTTTLPGGGECRYEDGQCRGGCGGNGTCRAALDSSACECRTTSCGDADAPECDGACPQPNEVCIFDFTGCGCEEIP
jgi:hypothetical protein